jgi:dynein heavy chain
MRKNLGTDHVDLWEEKNFTHLSWINEKIILGEWQICETSGYQFSESGIFKVPEANNVNSYMAYIRELPLAPRPEIFGLHENADITCDQNESYYLFTTVLSLQPREQTKGGGMSREDVIEKSCNHIQSVLPPLFDVELVLRKYPTMYSESMNTVLTQECIRYNTLLNILKISLRDSLKALKGLVVMSNDLEMLCTSVFNNQVLQCPNCIFFFC